MYRFRVAPAGGVGRREIRFTRAARGRVDAFTVTTPPARRVRFDKVN